MVFIVKQDCTVPEIHDKISIVVYFDARSCDNYRMIVVTISGKELIQ